MYNKCLAHTTFKSKKKTKTKTWGLAKCRKMHYISRNNCITFTCSFTTSVSLYYNRIYLFAVST